MHKSVYLKIKLKSLAYEARLIRHEERKAKELRNSLVFHRKFVVRPEARATLLAYGYLRGRNYRDIEPKATTKPDWSKVESMVKRYCDDGTVYDTLKQFTIWKKVD